MPLAQSTNSQTNMVGISIDAASSSSKINQAPARTQMTAKALAIREKVLQM
jgi:hypothetical protein